MECREFQKQPLIAAGAMHAFGRKIGYGAQLTSIPHEG